MKRFSWVIGGLLLAAIMLFTTSCDSLTSPRSSSEETMPSQSAGIWVTGEGKVIVTPDLAIISLGVEAQAETVAQAQADAAGTMDAIMNALKGSGVAEADIQTQQFSIDQLTRYDNYNQKQEITGYQVSNILTVKNRIIDDTGALISAAVEAGGDFIRIRGITFTVDDPALYQKEAREKAIDDAQEKAEQIAKKAGLKLGEPAFISETTSSYPYSGQQSYGLSVPEVLVSTSISPGETTITVIMQVAYKIK